MNAPALRAIDEVVEEVATWTPERDAPGKSFTYVDLSAVDQDTKAITGAKRIMGADAPSRARQLLASGDVLVSTVRPNLNAVARVPEVLDGATASTGFCVLRPRSDQLEGAYAFHWVRSPQFVAEMARRATGASYPAVSDRIIRESKLPLPSLAVQRRIAAILDKADELRAKRRAAIARLDTLAQSIFLEMFGDPTKNPKGWPRLPMGEVFEIARGGSPRPIEDFVTDDPAGINWITIGDASAGSKFITGAKRRIRPEGVSRSRAVKSGDFLLTNSMSFGRPYIMGTSGCIHDGWLVLSPRRDDVDVEFLYSLLGSPALYADFERRASGATVKNLNIDLVRGVEIPMPPSPVQLQFHQRVSAIDTLKSRQGVSLGDLDALFASLQHRAFSGAL